MKKSFMLFILMLLMFPMVVSAGSDSDDNAVDGHDITTQTCTYRAKGKDNSYYYAIFTLSGISNAAGGPGVSYVIKHQTNGKKVEVLYERGIGDGDSPQNDIYNYNQPYDTGFALAAYVQNVYYEVSSDQKKLEQAKDDNAFCPSAVYLLKSAKKGYKFMFCNGYDAELETDSCENVSNYIDKNDVSMFKDCFFCFFDEEDTGEIKVSKYDLYHGTAVSGSTVDNQQSVKEDIGKEKAEEEQTAEDVCNPESKIYDKEKCDYYKHVDESLDEIISDVGGYTEYNPDSLPDIGYNKVTCETIFKDEYGNYNATWKILNTTLKFIQYLGVVLALALSVLDFIKVVPSQDKGLLKKSATKAATRLGFAIAIFFIPIILDFVLDLIGITNATCGLLK